MRGGKLIGAATIAAVTVSASLGAGSASATVLCGAEAVEGACPAGQAYAFGTVVELEGAPTGPSFSTSTANVACGWASVRLSTQSEGGLESPVLGAVESMYFFECATVGTSIPCLAVVFELPQASFTWSSGSNGTMALQEGGGLGPLQLTLRCGANNVIKCAYQLEPTLSVTGGNPAQVAISEAPMEKVAKEGFTTCPKQSTWSAAYEATSPTAVYLAGQ